MTATTRTTHATARAISAIPRYGATSALRSSKVSSGRGGPSLAAGPRTLTPSVGGPAHAPGVSSAADGAARRGGRPGGPSPRHGEARSRQHPTRPAPADRAPPGRTDRIDRPARPRPPRHARPASPTPSSSGPRSWRRSWSPRSRRPRPPAAGPRSAPRPSREVSSMPARPLDDAQEYAYVARDLQGHRPDRDPAADRAVRAVHRDRRRRGVQDHLTRGRPAAAYHRRMPTRRSVPGAQPEPLFRPPPERQPLAARMRPRTLDEFVGQGHLVGERGPLRRSVARGHLASLLLWGPPGTGKTSLARLLADAVGAEFRPVSAVMSGVAEVRGAIAEAQDRLALEARRTVLFIDEIHRFNKSQQDALLPHVEDGTITLIGATTENPYFEVNSALLSRLRVWRLEPLSDDDVATIVRRALEDEERGVAGVVRPDGRRDPRAGGLRAPRRPRGRRRAPGAERARGRDRARRGRGPPVGRGRGLPHPRATSRPPPSSGSSPTTARATATTPPSPRSSRASAATTPTPPCTGWRRWSRPARTRGSSSGG